MAEQKISRGKASRFYVAGELSRRGYSVLLTPARTSQTDLVCSDQDATKFCRILVAGFNPERRSCPLPRKSEEDFGENSFWVLAGIPQPGSPAHFEYFIIPARVMSENVTKYHQAWLDTPGVHGQAHHDSKVRGINLPPYNDDQHFDITEFKERWDLIAEKLKA